ncbi:MAG TPA: pirin family protein [Methanoregula sp.]|nr:pirin family protein [Methanoregula sp.]
MAEERTVERVFAAYQTIEGAGVRLHRAFGYEEVPLFDPFLMLDDFRAGTRPEDYLAGFPWHPHRGIETVTYMLEGKVEHGDSMGNAGTVGAGDIQWMTAGSGIIHQEMPKPVGGRMGGFQLWVNLPSAEKMMDPRYQEVKRRSVPVVRPQEGTEIRIICGSAGGIRGPVENIVADPEYLDISLGPGTSYTHPVRPGYTAAAYIIGGEGMFLPGRGEPVRNRDMVLFSDGERVTAHASGEGFRFLFFSGRQFHEPVAWRGPIVMNTQEELSQAFREYGAGTFVKKAG